MSENSYYSHYEKKTLSDALPDILEGFVVFVMAIILFGMFILADFSRQPSPILASLTRDEWQCTKRHEKTRDIWVGKLLEHETRVVCDQYERKATP